MAISFTLELQPNPWALQIQLHYVFNYRGNKKKSIVIVKFWKCKIGDTMYQNAFSFFLFSYLILYIKN